MAPRTPFLFLSEADMIAAGRCSACSATATT